MEKLRVVLKENDSDKRKKTIQLFRLFWNKWVKQKGVPLRMFIIVLRPGIDQNVVEVWFQIFLQIFEIIYLFFHCNLKFYYRVYKFRFFQMFL